MTKFFTLLIIALFIQESAYNQVTITDLDPQVGDYFSLEGYESSLDPGSSGANVTWDFSALGVAENEIDYEVVLTDGLDGVANFPLSTKAWIASPDGLGDLIFYMGVENNAMLEYGSYFSIDGSTAEFNYSDPQKRYDSPLDYEDTGSDDIAGSLTAGGMELSVFTGDIVYDVDGYGTMIMPEGTYNNVLRVKTIQEELHDLSIMGVVQTTTLIGYSYFVEDYPLPVLIIEDSESYVFGELVDEFSSTTHLISYNGVPLNIEELTIDNSILIYPNPSTDHINIKMNYEGFADLKILNIDGKTVRSQLMQSNTKVNVADLIPGYYIVEILIDGQYFSRASFIRAQ